MERSFPHPAGSSVPVKILGFLSFLLLAAIMYNEMGSTQTATKRSTVHPAALPLQKRMRKSRYAAQVDGADTLVVPEHFKSGVVLPKSPPSLQPRIKQYVLPNVTKVRGVDLPSTRMAAERNATRRLGKPLPFSSGVASPPPPRLADSDAVRKRAPPPPPVTMATAARRGWKEVD